MKAILIDPWKRSLETIDITKGDGGKLTNQTIAALHDLYELVGEEGIDFCRIGDGECVIVGDHSALHNPPLPNFRIGGEVFYGRGVVTGFDKSGKERETRLTVDDISEVITWEE